MSDRLFGRPFAENLYSDLQSAVEVFLDEYGFDEHVQLPIDFEFEEFDVVPATEHLMSAEAIIEHFVEWSADNGMIDEDFSEHMDRIAERDDVRDAAQAFVDLFASHIKYRMANNRIGTHWIRVNAIDEHGVVDWREVTRQALLDKIASGLDLPPGFEL